MSGSPCPSTEAHLSVSEGVPESLLLSTKRGMRCYIYFGLFFSLFFNVNERIIPYYLMYNSLRLEDTLFPKIIAISVTETK